MSEKFKPVPNQNKGRKFFDHKQLLIMTMTRRKFRKVLNENLLNSAKNFQVFTQKKAASEVEEKKKAWKSYRYRLHLWQNKVGSWSYYYDTIAQYRADEPKQPDFPEPK